MFCLCGAVVYIHFCLNSQLAQCCPLNLVLCFCPNVLCFRFWGDLPNEMLAYIISPSADCNNNDKRTVVLNIRLLNDVITIFTLSLLFLDTALKPPMHWGTLY